MMKRSRFQVVYNTLTNLVLSSVLVVSLVGCAAPIRNRAEDVRLVTASDLPEKRGHPLLSFLVSEWQQPYNRIGKVQAEENDGSARVFVDAEQAVIYYERQGFTTERAAYTNLVYRVHFSETPFSLIPFHLTAGNNPGVLVIITLDGKEKPILVTTVNTCGCYVAIIPTSYLDAEAYPDEWPEKEQPIYGEILPARLEMTVLTEGLLVTIGPSVHRVKDVQVMPVNSSCPSLEVVAELQPLSILKSLPLTAGRTTSMYYDQWPLKGHVKGAIKPWESLLLSLVSLDLYVGMDKEYGNTAESGNPFYTSLKPWNRKISDMNDFAGFLKFYGWKL
ncbi:MAG: hypothetical protein KKH60_06975 [Proteobacteria bacterium]|nr:hypothetical protein [Pseudomonadota bacterium]MBU1138467.1 hypothetical protein [Pseudomonadota bacterium]